MNLLLVAMALGSTAEKAEALRRAATHQAGQQLAGAKLELVCPATDLTTIILPDGTVLGLFPNGRTETQGELQGKDWCPRPSQWPLPLLPSLSWGYCELTDAPP